MEHLHQPAASHRLEDFFISNVKHFKEGSLCGCKHPTHISGRGKESNFNRALLNSWSLVGTVAVQGTTTAIPVPRNAPAAVGDETGLLNGAALL